MQALALTFPRDGTAALRALLPRVLTRIAQQYLALPHGPDDALRAHAHRAAHALAAREAATLAELLALPTHSALLGAAVHEGTDAARARLEALDLHVLLALAARPDALGPVRVARPGATWPRLLSVTAGCALQLAPEVTHARFASGALVLEAPGHTLALDPAALAPGDHALAHVSEAFVPLVGAVRFALADNNPLAALALHPERAGNAVDLAGRDVAAWLEPLRAAFGLIARHLPALYEEMQLLLRTVVPVGYAPERHASCSYEDALGAIYLTLHPSPVKLAEALVHEFQHNKLHALMRVDPVLTNARTSRHRSPVRPDARPLTGVLLAVHAFVPVAMLYRAMTGAGEPAARSRDWAAQCAAAEQVYRDGAATLFDHAVPTRTGRALLDDLRDHITALERA